MERHWPTPASEWEQVTHLSAQLKVNPAMSGFLSLAPMVTTQQSNQANAPLEEWYTPIFNPALHCIHLLCAKFQVDQVNLHPPCRVARLLRLVYRVKITSPQLTNLTAACSISSRVNWKGSAIPKAWAAIVKFRLLVSNAQNLAAELGSHMPLMELGCGHFILVVNQPHFRIGDGMA